MPPAYPRGLVAGVKLFKSVGTSGVEQPEQHVLAGHVGGDERFRAQIADAIEHLSGTDIGMSRDCAGRCKVESPGEDREPAQDHSLCAGEKPVAPVQRGTQRLMPRQRRTTAFCQKLKTILDSRGQPADSEQIDPRRRELDRQ